METIDVFATAYPLDILVADQYPMGQTGTVELLHGLGYRPGVAASCGEVAQMTSTQKFDVILMDIRMPGLDQLLHATTRGPGARPIIIAMSGTIRPDFRETYLQTMADHCISRPLHSDELLLQLKACSVLAGKCRIR